MLDGESVFELKKNIVVRGLGEKCWAFDTDSGKQYRLNGVSCDVLSMLDGKKRVDEIIDIQIKHYNVDRETLFFDVLTFLEKAAEKNIVKEVIGDERV